MTVRSAVVVLGLGAILAAILPGCSMPTAEALEACGAACERTGLLAATAENGCRCQDAAAIGACSVDRLLVTPVPPGRKPAPKVAAVAP